MRISDWSSDVCSSDLDPNDCDLEQMMVLEHSLRQHASLPVDINWMQLSSDPQSFWYSDSGIPAGWHTERWATPFSGFLWAVPAYCGYEGRAIYMDTATLVPDDIAALWRAQMPEGTVEIGSAHVRNPGTHGPQGC